MASKKTKRSAKLTKSKDYNELALSDVLCPICRSILIEPVSLPCNHDFCMFCFNGTMENANLVCPLCRLRIGSWLRKATKGNVLMNGELWRAVKERFPQHVKNKLDGVDENIEEEEREVIVSYPGEIRKEYELQKQKEDEEQNKKRQEELKASEELIKKIREEEEYKEAVMEEKLKIDEKVAKELSEELATKQPSTSKMRIVYKKQGTMDKFVKKDNESMTTINANSFVNKEYTCRVLCLDTGKSSKESSPKIQKKIQQLQKIVDLEAASDGSDCIESEMRYFKPIDYRLNPPSQKKAPLKVTPKKLHRDVAAKVLSPSGLVNFCSNILESAFAKFAIDIPTTLGGKTSTLVSSPRSNSSKRTLSPTQYATPDKKLKTDSSAVSTGKDASPTIGYYKMCPEVRKKLFGTAVETAEKVAESPPFYGFDRTNKANGNLVKNRKNGRFVENLSKVTDANSKIDQERADLEFAKRLQEEFNKDQYTRSTRNLRITKKQKTLDEMIKSPYRVK